MGSSQPPRDYASPVPKGLSVEDVKLINIAGASGEMLGWTSGINQPSPRCEGISCRHRDTESWLPLITPRCCAPLLAYAHPACPRLACARDAQALETCSLNKITYIKNAKSWRADSVCLNIYPRSDQALCSHDSMISTLHIYGLPGCWAPCSRLPRAWGPWISPLFPCTHQR